MSVDDLYQKAREAIERSNYDYAVRLLRDVLRQRPDYPEARMALRATERRRLEEKGGGLGRAVTWPVRALGATLKAAAGRGAKKLEAYEDFLEGSPSSFWALTKAAGAARKLGLSGEAIAVYRDALRFKPDHKGSLRTLGNLLKEAGDHHEALKCVDRLSKLEPRNKELLKEVRDLTATEHMTAHKMEEAESFRDLIRDKELAEKLEQSGRMAVTRGDLQGRIPKTEQDVAEHPDSVPRILGLAALYRDTDQLAKAQQLLKEKCEALPDNFELHEGLGDIQLAVYDQAIEKAEAAAGSDPEGAGARAKAAELKERKAQFAAKEYKWRLLQHPTDREIQLKLGQVQFDGGNLNEAIAAFQVASQDSRYEMESCKMLGLCFMRKGQHDLALGQFERALADHREMDERGKELRYHQGQAYEEMGKTDEALAVYKKIYSQDINFRDVAAKVDALSG